MCIKLAGPQIESSAPEVPVDIQTLVCGFFADYFRERVFGEVHSAQWYESYTEGGQGKGVLGV